MIGLSPSKGACAGALALALAIGACGGDDETDAPKAADGDASPAAAVRAAYRDFEQATKDGDGAGACALMTPAGRRQMVAVIGAGEGSCEQSVSKFAIDTPGVHERPSRLEIEVDGRRATVVARNRAGAPVAVRMVEDGGEWRIAGLGGSGG